MRFFRITNAENSAQFALRKMRVWGGVKYLVSLGRKLETLSNKKCSPPDVYDYLLMGFELWAIQHSFSYTNILMIKIGL